MGNPVELLQEQIQRAEILMELPNYSQQYRIWCDTTVRILRENFNSEYIEMFNNAGPKRLVRSDSGTEARRAFIKTVDEKIQLLSAIIAEYSRLHNNPTIDISRAASFQKYDFHESIKAVSLKLYENKHYAQAVEEAFKRVVVEVKRVYKDKTGQEADGDALMNKAFGSTSQTPIIAFNTLLTQGDKDEQQGIMYLFKGVVGIRNNKAHNNIILDDPTRATEYLSLASLLMRLLDRFAV